MLKPSTASHGLFATLFPYFVFSLLGLGLFFLLLHFVAPRLERRMLCAAQSSTALFLATGIFGLLYAGLAWTVLTFPGFIDPGEPMIASVSWFAVHGDAVYKMFIAYGPFCYFPYGLALRAFGAGIPALKLTVLAGNLVLLGLLWAVLRKSLRPRAVLLVIGLVIAACMMKQVYLLQIRGDLFIYIAVALGMLAATARRRWVGLLLLTLALFLGIDIKITAVLYLLYPCVQAGKRWGWHWLVAAGAAAGVLSLAPFLLPNLSLPDYIHWLRAMARQPRSSKELLGNFLTTAVLLFPCGLMYWQLRARDVERARSYLLERRLPLCAWLLGMLSVDVLAGKFGAGRHHLIPFFIVSACVSSEIFMRMQDGAERTAKWGIAFAWAAFGLLLLLAEASELHDLWRLTATERAQAVGLKQDVRALEKRFAGEKMEIGAGRGLVDLDTQYSPQYAAAWLVFAGNPYTFDESAEADRELLQFPMPAAAIEYLRSCATSVWLLPRGDAPFDTLSIYSDMYPRAYPGHRDFSDDFRRVFAQTYERGGNSRYFDIYVCRKNG